MKGRTILLDEKSFILIRIQCTLIPRWSLFPQEVILGDLWGRHSPWRVGCTCSFGMQCETPSEGFEQPSHLITLQGTVFWSSPCLFPQGKPSPWLCPQMRRYPHFPTMGPNPLQEFMQGQLSASNSQAEPVRDLLTDGYCTQADWRITARANEGNKPTTARRSQV